MRVCVYGSLRKGLGNHRLLQDSEYLGMTQLCGMFRMVSLGGFPALIESTQPADITGEVYDVTDAVMDRLDGLEGYPTFYDRKVVETQHGKAWVYYLHSGEDYPIVEGGDWIEYQLGGVSC